MPRVAAEGGDGNQMRGVREVERLSYGLFVRLASCVHAFSPEVPGGVDPHSRGLF
jgi:hypothetical protein